VRVPIPFFDKLLHAGEYAVLGFLCARAVFGTARQHHRQHIVLLVALFCFLYGCTDEYHQLFVAGRAASLADALADGIGGTLGALLYRS